MIWWHQLSYITFQLITFKLIIMQITLKLDVDLGYLIVMMQKETEDRPP